MSQFNPQSQHNWNETVKNHPFFPDLDLAEFARLHRITGAIDEKRAKDAVHNALLQINHQAAAWKTSQIFKGFETLEDTDNSTGDNEQNYQTAVFNLAKAQLLNEMRDWDNTASGHDRADEGDTRIDTALQLSREALRRLIGHPRATIELI